MGRQNLAPGGDSGSAQPTVLILGMGDTGVLTAAHLPKSCRVVCVTTKPFLVSGQELGHRLAEHASWRRDYLLPLHKLRRLADIEIIHGKATAVDSEGRSVTVLNPGGDQIRVAWDYLVIATGVGNGFWRDDDLDTADGIEQRLAAQVASVAAADTIAVVGGGPCGTSTAFNLKRRYPGKAVTLCLSDSLPLPGYAEATRRHHRDQLLQQGVSLVTGSRAQLPADAELCQMAGGVLRFADGTPDIPADLIIWTTGKLRPHTAFLPRDMLDDHGFVPTDAHLNVPGYQRIFAIGDVAATDPLRCSARNWAYRILCRNIVDRIADRPPSARFDPPAARWGSILGLQPNGLYLHAATGRRWRVPRWLVTRFLYPVVVRRWIYGGTRR